MVFLFEKTVKMSQIKRSLSISVFCLDLKISRMLIKSVLIIVFLFNFYSKFRLRTDNFCMCRIFFSFAENFRDNGNA